MGARKASVHKASLLLYRDWYQLRQESHAGSNRKAMPVEIDRSVTRVPVDASGTHLAVRRYAGKGVPLVMIHGITSSGNDFDHVATRLTDICNPLTIDLRGHGGSDKPRKGYHYTDYVSDLSEVIRRLGLVQPIVLGHSLGGIIAMYWAAANPRIARGIIIEDSPLRSGDDFRDAFEGWLYLNDLPEEKLREWYASHHPKMSADTLDYRTHAMMATRREAITELYATSMAKDGLDASDTLGNIIEPVLYLHGETDHGSMVHPEDLADLPSKIRNLRVRGVYGAGHSPHRSHSNEWLHHVRKFISALQD